MWGHNYYLCKKCGKFHNPPALGRKFGPRPKEVKDKLRKSTLEQFKNGMPEETKIKLKKAMFGESHSCGD